MTTTKNPVGRTTSQGWEIGIRRTFPIGPHQAWELLFTHPLLSSWLDDKADLPFEKGNTYTTKTGITITVSSVTTGKVIRMKWQQPGDPQTSTLQIRIIPAKEKTTISFHHEWLKNGQEREAMKNYWGHVLDEISRRLKI
ncbi:activator of Hsp90 ATPase-like protein [Chitinophaga polysaccharea]|uniref:Activator of Hsp90 ATPase-like protein n=1 Tax=Chitinophaga polysaccharea TaxID=1293035 RepID=A0A561Q5M3_9BACT|nr:SRPBCC domain-containing protein [Chitinophaga polysaccharea]TWF45665.1 activator of Hsp90 ATPase-like protein [Chitinophaga polysaccharea]